jgi:nucleotidyltransferase/DNA polymerase involved in DNA repair
VFESFTPRVEPLSLDEAFLDVGGSARLFGTPVEIARRIKERVAELGLPCTVGVAPNKFLAKVASTRGKPDGLLVVPADSVEAFLYPLPVAALWGVGEHTEAALRRLGLSTVGDVARVSRRTLERSLGDALGAHIHDLARGIDERPVQPLEVPKSVGCENTFDVDLDSTGQILRELLRLCDRAGARLRAKGMCCRTVTIKVRLSNFQTLTRAKTLGREIAAAAEVYDVARELYARVGPDRPRVRLLGVSLSGLSPGSPRVQMDLFDVRQSRTSAASAAIDDIRERFGDEAVGPAALLDEHA